MPSIADLVHQTSTTTGTGNFTLSTVNGRQSFSVAFGTGSTEDDFYYFISHQTAAQWEVGTGHMSSATTLVRDTVLASSNSGAKVSFSAGTKDITNDLPAANQLLGGASQAQMEAATSSDVAVTPDVAHYHPAMPKAVGSFSCTAPPGVTIDFNVLGTLTVTRNGVGDYTISWTNSLTHQRAFFTGLRTAGNGFATPEGGIGSTSVTLRVVNGALTAEDIAGVNFVIYGDL